MVNMPFVLTHSLLPARKKQFWMGENSAHPHAVTMVIVQSCALSEPLTKFLSTGLYQTSVVSLAGEEKIATKDI